MRACVLLVALASLALADRNSFDCKMRQLGVDFAQKLQPFRDVSSFQAMADALNGAPEAAKCSVAPSAMTKLDLPRHVSLNAATEYYVDAVTGSDSNPGTIQSPVQTIAKGVELSRSTMGPKTVFLRAGTFYLPSTVQLGAEDSGLTIAAYNGEEVYVSGGIPLTTQWKSYSTTWIVEQGTSDIGGGTPTPGKIVVYGKVNTWQDCQTACQQNTSFGGCNAWTWHDTTQGSYALDCYFRYDGVWDPKSAPGHVSGKVVPIYVADLTGQGVTSVPGLRQDGQRGIRARYPNANPEIQGFGSDLMANGWVPSTLPSQPDIEMRPPEPSQNNSQSFQEYQIGIGGPCVNFEPSAGYWCGNETEGGWNLIYHVPSGMIANTSVLPNSPYKNPVGAVIQTWHPAHWASWMFEVGSVSGSGTGNHTYTFSKGGFQDARGADMGSHFYIENVFEELDFPGEYFFDESTNLLFLYYNGTTAPPTETQYVATNVKVLFNITGTQSAPVKSVTISGVNFRDTAYTYLDPHGMPSGGDWALQRTAAIFIEGTEDVTIEDGLFTRLDGNALMLSGYNRGAIIQRNEFAWIGDTAIAQWGNTEGVEGIPGMGWIGTGGDQPRGTQILYNFVHELGIWEKQSSFYFQAKSCENLIMGNIFFNGPRAGINFNDGFGGGSNITYNILFNTCRESGDHGPFNSWDRQLYVTDVLNGQPSVTKQWDDISHNFIIANYDSQEGIDNDDGSCYYHTHDNFMSYSGNGLKSDFGGHDNDHHGNVYAYVGCGFSSFNPQLPGHLNLFYGNTIIMTNSGNYTTGIACSGDGMPVIGNNTIYTPDGQVSECGMSLAAWQAKGNDLGSTVTAYPSNLDDILIGLGQKLLALP